MEKTQTGRAVRPVSLFLFFLLCALLLSCQTAPKTANAVLDEAGYIPLNPGGFAYIFADIKTARPILNNLSLININDKQLRKMLNRTKSAVAAVYYSAEAGNVRQESPPLYQLAAWGSYPVSTARMALGASKGWKKQRSSITGTPYWYAEKGGISVAVNPRQANAAVAQGNTPADPFSDQTTPVPEGFGEFRRGAAISCWINTPSSFINQKLREMGIPLELPAEQLFISLFPAPQQPDRKSEQRYEARLRILVSSAAQARAITSLFTIARGFFPLQEFSVQDTSRDNSPGRRFAIIAAFFLANPPVQDGKSLTITTNTLSAREVALLFNMFLP